MLGFSIENNHIPQEEAVRLTAQAGFDAIALNWKQGIDLLPAVLAANEQNLHILYLHAPQGQYYTLWLDAHPPMLDLVLSALEDCRRFGIPVFVMHTCSDWAEIEPAREIGLKNYKVVTDLAAKYGIKVALENTARPAYLKILMDFYKDDPNVGFCWDCGHEQCYTPGEPILEQYGQKLMTVHLCDNLGLTDPGGIAASHDDLHLIPFDGIADWQTQITRLKNAKPLNTLCLELKMLSKPGRQKVDLYRNIPSAEFIQKAYAAGQKLSELYFGSK